MCFVRCTVEGVATELTDQQALQEGGVLGVTGREPPILVQAFLGERELGRGDQRGHGDLDPLLTRAWA